MGYNHYEAIFRHDSFFLYFQLFFAAGGFCEVLLAIVVLEPLGWRWWLIFTATPLVIFIIFCFVSAKFFSINKDALD